MALLSINFFIYCVIICVENLLISTQFLRKYLLVLLKNTAKRF